MRVLNGMQLGGRNVRLSWGRSPNNRQVLPWFPLLVGVPIEDLGSNFFFFLLRPLLSFCGRMFQSQPDQNQWNNAAYYGYPQGYDSYGYVSAPQDPNMYYGGYPGYGGYAMPQQAQMPLQQQVS